MAGILSLKSEDKRRLHPEALEWFNTQMAEIQFEVPLEELSEDDLNAFLQDAEKREFQSCMEEISKGMATCIDMGGVSPDPLVNARAGLTVLKFELNSLRPMYRVKILLKNVHQRKIEKAEQEQRERDEMEKRSREQAEAELRRNEAEKKWRTTYK